LLSYKLTYEITTVKRAATTRPSPFSDDANFYNVGVNEFPPARSIYREARAPPGSSHWEGRVISG
jgi:hypothetical protein